MSSYTKENVSVWQGMIVKIFIFVAFLIAATNQIREDQKTLTEVLLKWDSRDLAAGASYTAAHLPAGWAPLVLPAPTAHRDHHISLPPGFAEKERSEFCNPLKKKTFKWVCSKVLKMSWFTVQLFFSHLLQLASSWELPARMQKFFAFSFNTWSKHSWGTEIFTFCSILA